MFNVSMVIFLSLCIQSLDGLSGASCEVAYLSCNLSHNRFRNIYPCKSLKYNKNCHSLVQCDHIDNNKNATSNAHSIIIHVCTDTVHCRVEPLNQYT